MLASALLGARTIRAMAVLMPGARAQAEFVTRSRLLPRPGLRKALWIPMVLTFLMGAWILHNTASRAAIPIEQARLLENPQGFLPIEANIAR